MLFRGETMRLSEFLTLRQESDSAFALRFGGKCTRTTVANWRVGRRVPRAAHKERITELTGGLVTPADWHALELGRARAKAAA